MSLHNLWGRLPPSSRLICDVSLRATLYDGGRMPGVGVFDATTESAKTWACLTS